MKIAKLSLRRLLDRQTLYSWLASFIPLLTGIRVALVENDGRIFMELVPPPGAKPLAGVAPVISFPLEVQGQVVGSLRAAGQGVTQSPGKLLLPALSQSLELLLSRSMDSRELAQEVLERYREINLLYKIGETIGASLDPEVIPGLILKEAVQVIQSDVGCVALGEELGEFRVVANFGFDPSGCAFQSICCQPAASYLPGAF